MPMKPIPDIEEIQPLTPEQRQAIRDCRFSTTVSTREYAWLVTNDEKVANALAGVVRRTETYVQDWKTRLYGHDMMISHPEALDLVEEIMAERRA